MCGSVSPFGMKENAAIAIADDRVVWIGDMNEISDDQIHAAKNTLNCEGRLLTPGLIDCHTHIVHGGNRAIEFEMRLNGASYEDIANAGGGIISTVRDTRNASEDELLEQTKPRLQGLMTEGVTTVEIKSGYGLTTEDEAKMLRVARRLGDSNPIRIVTSFLGAHAIPPEYKAQPDDYIDLICNEMLPAIAAENLADAVDAFCESIAFSPEQVSRVFDAAAAYHLPIKLHAEQLSDLKGATMASRRKALSVDHLEYLNEADASVLAKNDTVAVLLPGAFYCLRETKLPPIQSLRDQNVSIALATDSNPGSSPVGSLILMLSMGCTLFGLTPEESLAGVTRNAAKALGLENEVGTIEVGKRADLAIWDVHSPAELSYRIGGNPCFKSIYAGKFR